MTNALIHSMFGLLLLLFKTMNPQIFIVVSKLIGVLTIVLTKLFNIFLQFLYGRCFGNRFSKQTHHSMRGKFFCHFVIFFLFIFLSVFFTEQRYLPIMFPIRSQRIIELWIKQEIQEPLKNIFCRKFVLKFLLF